MEIQKINFKTFCKNVTSECQDGIVLLGTGGDPLEWVFGVTNVLHQEGIIDHNDYTKAWDEAFLLTTTGGRHDISLTFNSETTFDIMKMAMWRLRFGNCSWISDYVVNYEDQHA